VLSKESSLLGRLRFSSYSSGSVGDQQQAVLTLHTGQIGIRNPMSDENSLEGAHERTCIIVNKLTDPQTDEASGNPEAAMCVRKSSARRVLQFTPFNVASYVLHRPASRVIHRLQLYFSYCISLRHLKDF
jgi:hypothetical protein